MENQAAIGGAAVMILVIFLGVLLMRANVISGAFMRFMGALLHTRTALVTGVVLVMLLLLVGITRYGMINSLPAEQHIAHTRDSNRFVITEDKDGCGEMRMLGRSSGIYMAVQPCKPDDKAKAVTPYYSRHP